MEIAEVYITLKLNDKRELVLSKDEAQQLFTLLSDLFPLKRAVYDPIPPGHYYYDRWPSQPNWPCEPTCYDTKINRINI